MPHSELTKKYMQLFREGVLTVDDRLELARGLIPDGTPTPPEILAQLFFDDDQNVREEAKKSILRLKEESLIRIAADEATHPDLLLFIAKKFHDSPAIGVAIVGNKNITDEVLWFLQGKEGDFSPTRKEEVIEVSPDGIEVDIIDDDKVDTGDYEISIEFEGKEGEEETASSIERYAEDDMEITIEMDDEAGGDDLLSLLDRGKAETDTLGDERREFSSTVDEIEGKFGEVFDVEPTTIEDAGDRPAGDEESIETSVADETIPPPETREEGAIVPDLDAETVRPKASAPQSTFRDVSVDDSKKVVSVATERFVTRLPMGRYFYKKTFWDIAEPFIKLSVPVFTFLIVIFVLWISIPEPEVPVENFENGINRIFVEIKNHGMNPKIKNPFPEGYNLATWKVGKTSADSEFSSGKMKKDFDLYRSAYLVEYEIDELNQKIAKNKNDTKQNLIRIKDIDDELSRLESAKEIYTTTLAGERPKADEIEEMYKKEIQVLEKEYNDLESRVQKLEADLADVRKRISEFESTYGRNESSPGHEANKMELDELTKKYNEVKPEYDRMKASYPNTKKDIKEKYQVLLGSTVGLKDVEKKIEDLNAEKTQLEFENEFLESEIKDFEESMKKLKKSNTQEKEFSSDDEATFLVMGHYMEEKEFTEGATISSLKSYTIVKRNATIDINFSGEGEKKSVYTAVFMRMDTAKKFLFFHWDADTTMWVLTSIAEKKKKKD
jgi:predicted  nucleic acid-binding Zn-ribbon protein